VVQVEGEVVLRPPDAVERPERGGHAGDPRFSVS
jgi:hypothetical protein